MNIFFILLIITSKYIKSGSTGDCEIVNSLLKLESSRDCCSLEYSPDYIVYCSDDRVEEL